MPTPRRWKGKAREVTARDVTMEGTGGAGGVVLPLDVVGSGIYDVAYTIPVKFSASEQQFSLQVDTGSSDLWVASTSCSSSSCSLTKGRLYDSSSSRPTGKDFTIPYLQGSASGPILWDVVTLGGYSINNQALAAASDVEEEPLTPDFSGVLGLALPLNSIIAQQIPPVTSNAPDGAAWASNLFSITPAADAPAARFISLSLSRPGSDAVASLLGIGRHPAALVPDPSKIQYAGLVSDRNGILFWKASVRAITVYVNSIPRPVDLGRSVNGAAFPSAVLDSGVPLILTTTPVANAIYGAIGVTPASDGTYYVPCQTPLNLTITLDDRPETPIHPLDLTSEPENDNNAQFCIGLIQPADSVLAHANNAIGDMVLGVPFLRNTYTVMAYTPPNSDGTFPTVAQNSSSSSPSTASDDDQPSTSTSPTRVSTDISPVLGILPLTDPTRALAEFTTVRVLNQPLSSTSATPPDTGANSNTKTVSVGGKKLAVGIVVLIGLVSLLAVCAALFAGRWLVMKRRFKKQARKAVADSDSDLDRKTMYRLARRLSATALGSVPLVRASDGRLGDELTEDELREMRYRSWKRMTEKQASESTSGSDRTLAAAEYGANGAVDEFGVVISERKPRNDGMDEDAWDQGNTLVDKRTPADHNLDIRSGLPPLNRTNMSEATPLVSGEHDTSSPPSSPEQATFPHARNYSDSDSPATHPGHGGTPSVSIPLLAGERSRTMSYADTVEAIASSHARFFSIDGDTAPSLPPGIVATAPITASQLMPSSHSPARQDSDRLDDPDFALAMPRTSDGSRGSDDMADDVMGEQRSNEEMGMGMAGIGSAARLSIPGFVGRWPRPSIDSLPFNRESLMSVSSVGTVVPGMALGSPSEGAEDEERRKGGIS